MYLKKRRTKKGIMASVESTDGGKIIDSNTIEYNRADGSKVIRFHLTDIIVFNPDGSVTLNSGGWQTVTTKDRLNKYSGFGIFQDKGVWYVSKNHTWSKDIVFADSITLWPDGRVEGAGADPKVYIELNKKINKYVKGFMVALTSRKLSAPSGGDCWDCAFRSEDGKSMGDLKGFKPGQDNHILSHFKDKYYVPSLLTNALEEFGASMAANSAVGYWLKMHEERSKFFEAVAHDQVEKSLKRYLKRRLGMAA